MENMENEVKEVMETVNETTGEIITQAADTAVKTGNNTLRTVGKIGIGVGVAGTLIGGGIFVWKKWIKPAISKRKAGKADRKAKVKGKKPEEAKQPDELDPNDVKPEDLKIDEE